MNGKSFDFENGIYVSHSPYDQIEDVPVDYAPMRRFNLDIGGIYAADSTYKDTDLYDHEAYSGNESHDEVNSQSTVDNSSPPSPLHARFPLFEHTPTTIQDSLWAK